MTFTYVEVSKNTYPYRTLHLMGCGVLSRARFARTLNHTDIQRLDAVRLDICKRCMPTGQERNQFGNLTTTYHEGQRNLWAIQRAFKEDAARTWRKVHLARKVIALRLALEAAEAELDMNDPQQVDFLNEYDRTGRAGDYRLPEVTIGR